MNDVAITLTVNGTRHRATVPARTSLADLLREHLNLTGTHLGCEHGVCGACTVLLDGEPARSCITLAASCAGHEVTTVEGLHDPAADAIREAFAGEHGLQCGFCTPGMLITAADVVRRHPGIGPEQAAYELAGNLCRCTGYIGIIRAVCRAADTIRTQESGRRSSHV
jgi:carbon-monoxide dehydrogenase small subunit